VFGSYSHQEEKRPGAIALKERVAVAMARVSPDAYAAFGEFLTAVDRSQAREWILETTAPAVPPAQTARLLETQARTPRAAMRTSRRCS